MRAHMTNLQVREFIIDTVIIKSKLILNKSDFDKLLKKSKIDLAKVLLENEIHEISVRPEEVQALVDDIRIQLGDIDKRDEFAITDAIVKDEELLRDFNIILNNYVSLMDWHREKFGVEQPIGQEFIDQTIKVYKVSELSVLLFLEKLSISLNGSIGSTFSQRLNDQPLYLNNLFKSEQLPEGSFFDQRFINYLFMNIEKLENIHWRQFEGLVAEFFDREGYEVILNKGRNDGGIDILARHLEKETVTIIQCKRYKKGRPISIESVKSFCFDLIDGNYDNGIIVTTSYLTDGEKKLYRNKYNVSEVESAELKTWLFKMFK